MLLRSRGVPVGDRLRAHGALTARPRRAHGAPTARPRRAHGAPTARPRRAHGVLGAATARARRARGFQSVLTAFFNFIFKTARRYLRKRHSSSDSGGVTHTFAIRCITSSIDIRMGGKNKTLKAVKTEGKGRESVVLRLLIHAVHRHCASKDKPWRSRPCLREKDLRQTVRPPVGPRPYRAALAPSH